MIPIRMGLIGADGADIPLTLEGETQEGPTERVLVLGGKEQEFVFTGVDSDPVPSLLRGFSAPVRLDIDSSDTALAFRMMHDSDDFNRWDAGQEYARRVLLAGIADYRTPIRAARPTSFRQPKTRVAA